MNATQRNALLERDLPRIRSILFRLNGPRNFEDVVHEVVVLLLVKLSKSELRGHIAPSIVKFAYIDYVRTLTKRGRRSSYFHEGMARLDERRDGTPLRDLIPDRESARTEASLDVEEWLERHDERGFVRFYYGIGVPPLSMAEIAVLAGCSESRVSQVLKCTLPPNSEKS